MWLKMLFVTALVILMVHIKWTAGDRLNSATNPFLTRSSDCNRDGYSVILDKKVVKVEFWTRPLSSLGRRRRDLGSGIAASFLDDQLRRALVHAGVVATTTDGQRYLVEKGDGYGDSWDTIVTCTSDHDGKWTMRYGSKFVSGHRTLANYVQSGGRDYSLAFDNCQHAAKRMYDLY